MNQRDSLNESLRVVELKNLKYEGNFIFTATETIGENNFDHAKLKDECEKIAKLIQEHCPYQTVRLKGNYNQRSVFESYISDVVTGFKLGYKKTKGLIQKFIEQRLPNLSDERKIDNFRYLCEIGTNTASPMLTPYGYITDKKDYKGRFFQIDRSTLEECISRNALPNLKLEETPFSNEKEFNLFKDKVKLDKITKTELIAVYQEFKDKLDDEECISDFWENLMNKVEDESADCEFTFWELIKDDKFVIDSLKNGLRQFEIIIGRYAVVSRELEKINNKGNIWDVINYECRKIWGKLTFSMVGLIQEIHRDTAKYIKFVQPMYSREKSFRKLYYKAPEYQLLPYLALHMWSNPSKSFSYQKDISDDSRKNWHNFVEFLEGKQIQKLSEHYQNVGINEETIESELEIDLVYNLFSVNVDEWVKKLKSLKKYLDFKSQPKLLGAKTKIDAIVNESYGVNPLLIHSVIQTKKLPNGLKMLKEQENVQKIVDMYMKSHFGDHIFTIDKSKETYNIKDPEFLKYLTNLDEGGYPNSHEGRGNLFLNKERFDKFKTYYDEEFNSEPNIKYALREIEAMKQITTMTELIWYENSKQGKPVACGYNSDGKIKDVSAEHLENDTNKVRVLRHINPNSAEGRVIKTITTESEWYRHIANIQDEFKDLHGTKLNMVKVGLNTYAEHLETEER